MTVGGAFGGTRPLAQDPASHVGKVLRLRDDGSAPDDNPFAGREGHAPEVFSLGHRNPMGLAIHPETGEVWASEHAPMGGDEVKPHPPGPQLRLAGGLLLARVTRGLRVSERPWQEDLEQPEIVWIPSIAPSGLVFYSGDRFPAWRGDLFAGSLMTAGPRRPHRPPRAHRVQPAGAGAAPGMAPRRSPPAHPRRRAGPRRPALRADRRQLPRPRPGPRRSRPAPHRAGPVT